MKPIHFVLILLITVASYFIGRQTSPEIQKVEPTSVPPAQCEAALPDCAAYEELKTKLAGVSPEEIRDYLRSTDAEEKLKKADEILGKIMQVLVAQVGFRLEKQELDQFGQVSKSIDNQPKAAPVPEPIAQPKTGNPNAQVLSRQLQTQIRNARTEEEAKKILDGLSKDFSSRLQQSAVLTQQQIRELNGNYEGALIEIKNPAPLRVTLNFRGRLMDNKLTGNARVQIYSEDGKVNSEGNSRGDLSKAYSGSDHSIFIEVGSRYMELVYFPNMGQWMGTMLEMQRGNFVKTGDVFLRRR